MGKSLFNSSMKNQSGKWSFKYSESRDHVTLDGRSPKEEQLTKALVESHDIQKNIEKQRNKTEEEADRTSKLAKKRLQMEEKIEQLEQRIKSSENEKKKVFWSKMSLVRKGDTLTVRKTEVEE